MAYNSLVEKPMGGNFEKKDELKMTTLPTKSSGRWREKTKSIELTLPREKAPRPSTLPYRASLSVSPNEKQSPQDSDVNPLKKLRDKNFGFIKSSRTKSVQIVTNENIPPECNIENQDDCNINLVSELDSKNTDNKDIDSLNPIPLPPRDKSKVTITKPKRHVRKHPLIIPGTGLQRTLDKVTQKSPTDESLSLQKSLASNNNYNVHPTKQLESSKLKGFGFSNPSTPLAKQFIENNFPIPENNRTYQNIEELMQNNDNMDSASLHFESILENVNDLNSLDVVDGGRGGSDGIDCFDIHKDHLEKETKTNFLADDELKNLDIEKKKIEFMQRHPKYVQPTNELASNVLFNKIKSTVESAASTSKTIPRMRSKSEDAGDEDDEAFLEGDFISTANDVSCEDLLEFANEKPNGRERGVDSDEVRIMSKVLGKTVSIIFI